MAVVMLSEAQDCDEPERVLSNGRNLSPIASCGRFVGNSEADVIWLTLGLNGR